MKTAFSSHFKGSQSSGFCFVLGGKKEMFLSGETTIMSIVLAGCAFLKNVTAKITL